SVPMLISIPAAYRTSRITQTLRERGVPPISPDDQTIPPDTAVAIITELKKTLPPKIQPNKLIAQRTLQIFETLNSRPPGWAATLGLLLAWGGTVGLAVMFTLVIIIGQVGNFGRFWAAARHSGGGQPVACGAHSSWHGEQAYGGQTHAPITI